MQAVELIRLLAALAAPGDRTDSARRVATALGADDLVMLIPDAETDVYLPSLGLRKTLPGGPEWRGLLATLRHHGIHRAQVPDLNGQSLTTAVACSGEGTSAVLLGGHVSDDDAELVCSMLPLLAISLR